MATPILHGIQNIVFDLGRVLYAIDEERTRLAFEVLNPDFSLSYTKQRQSDIFLKLERGEISSGEFRTSLRTFGLDAPDSEIDAAWNALLVGLYPGRVELLQRLRPHYKMALLSNTNAIHYKYFIAECEPAFALLDHLFFSYEMGCRKPDAEIFSLMLEKTGFKPKETLFIDDVAEHIKTAKKLGIKTYHLVDPSTLDTLLSIDK